MVKLGIIWMPRNAREAAEIAQHAEDLGFWGIGFCDSPILYDELYTTISHVLSNTQHIMVGSQVTNPVSRHWTVHAAAARTLHRLHGDRFFLGLASGDSALHSIGMKPATPEALEAAVGRIRGAGPEGLRVLVAAGGPKSLQAAGRAGTGVVLGTGLDPVAIQNLVAQTTFDRGQVDFELWSVALLSIFGDAADRAAALEKAKPRSIAFSRHAFDFTFAGKNVPEHLQQTLAEGYQKYQFAHHARIDGVNPNAEIFNDYPEIVDYLIKRFVLFGTEAECAEQLDRFTRDVALDGVWLSINETDPLVTIQRAARSFRHVL